MTGFILIWLSSALSPLLLFLSVSNGYASAAGFIVAVTVAAYLPWEHGPISRFVGRFYNVYHPRYYLGMRVVYEGGRVPSLSDPQTFYAVHPHGAFCLGWSQLFLSPEMSHVRFCFAPTLYMSPFFRLFSRLVGRPGSAARPAMSGYMKRGEHLALPPGGFEEATLSSLDRDRAFIKKRTGFVKLCLKHGVRRIRPVYAFGERRLFWNVQGLWGLRLALNRFGIPTICVWGRWFCPLAPRNDERVTIVVGRPIELPLIEDPTKEDVVKWHGEYIKELRRVFEDHKEGAYGAEEGKVAKLEIW